MRKIRMIKNAVYGYVVGDALGFPLENFERNELLKKPIYNMLDNPNYDLPDGVWTSNTSLMLATMDSIYKSNDINYDDIADSFCSWINNNAYTATNIIVNLKKNTRESIRKYWDEDIKSYMCGSDTSITNEALIRMLPIAIYINNFEYTDQESYEVIKNVTTITNYNEISIMASYIYVKFINLLLNGNSFQLSYKLLKKYDYTIYFSQETISKFNRILNDNIYDIKLSEINSESDVISTLESMFYILLNTNNYKEALVCAINLGNSTSEIASLVGSCAGIIYQFKNIPVEWLKSIKNKYYLNKIIKLYNKAL